MMEQEKIVRSKEWQRLQLSFPIPLYCSRRRGRRVVSEVESGKREGCGGEGVSRFLISHYPTLINWQEFKLTSLSQVFYL